MIIIKKLYSLLLISTLIIISYETITNSQEILNSVNFSFNIWKTNIFPSLFPFFIISYLLINYGFVELLSEVFKPLMNLFGINSKCAFIFIMSIVSGFPSNALYAKKLYEDGSINEYEASKVLTFSHFSNPLFLLGTLSILFLNNKEAGLLVLLAHYSTNFIIGLIFRNYYKSSQEESKINIKKGLNNMFLKIDKSENFGTVLTKSIKQTISTLLTILGTITVFLVITTIINSNIHLNNFYQSILDGLFEMTQGLKYISMLNIPLKLKSTICGMLISFGGLSVHMQVISVISDTKIKYYPFFIARVIHMAITGLVIFIFFDSFIYFT